MGSFDATLEKLQKPMSFKRFKAGRILKVGGRHNFRSSPTIGGLVKMRDHCWPGWTIYDSAGFKLCVEFHARVVECGGKRSATPLFGRRLMIEGNGNIACRRWRAKAVSRPPQSRTASVLVTVK